MAGKLFITDGTQGHKHFAYINEETGVGVTSVDKGHAHPIKYDEQMGGWFVETNISPKTGKGHAHVLYEYSPEITLKPDEDENSDNDIVANVYALFSQWVSDDEENIERAIDSEKFAWGDQWDLSIKKDLESEGRSALTMNSMERMIDGLLGEQRQERTDLKYLPQEGGDQTGADIMTHTSKWICERTNFAREESKVFEDTVVVGRGLFNIDVSFKDNIEGDIVIEKFPWSDVVFGPHEKEDLEDCEGLIKHKLYSKAKIKSLYPNKAKEIEKSFLTTILTDQLTVYPNTVATDVSDSLGSYDGAVSSSSGNMQEAPSFPLTTGKFANIDIARKELRVFECWRKMFTTVSVAVNPNDGFVQVLEGWKPSDVAQIQTIPGIYIIPKELVKMRITTVVGNVLISDEYPADLPTQDFYIVPVYAKKKGGQWKGKVWGGIDAQREINKRRSQAIDIGNQSGYGWFYDDTTFSGEGSRDAMDFKKNISSPNFAIKIADVKNPPMRVEGLKFPAEIVRLLEMSEANLQATMALELSPGGANESGSHMLQRKKAHMAVNEYLFDNLAFAKKKIGKLLVGLIQKYFSPERIMRIINNKAAKMGPDEMLVGGQPIGNYTPEQLYEVLSTTDFALYDVEVSESRYSPTNMLAMFMSLSEMARSGLAVPPELLIEFVDAPAEAKQKAKALIAQQSQAQQSAADATQRTEVNKSLLGQGFISQEVEQTYQPKPIGQMVAQQQQQPMQGQPPQGIMPAQGPQLAMPPKRMPQ